MDTKRTRMTFKDTIERATTVVLVICAVTVTILVARRELLPAAELKPQKEQTVAAWQTFAQNGHRDGPQNAPVQIVVFSDFQCPACRQLAQYLKIVRSQYPEQVAVVHRHFPLPSHPFAIQAVRASECAAEQGHFTELHDALFADQSSIGLRAWTQFARSAGIPDIGAFEECFQRKQGIAALERDTVDANRLGIVATPGYLVNETLYSGVPPLSVLQKNVATAMARTRANPVEPQNPDE